MADLTVVIVSWNSRELLQSCLESLRESVDRGLCEVTVVDNGSSDGSPEIVRFLFPHVKLIESAQNLGFARANNLALAQARTPYVLLLNSDTLVSAAALEGMLAAMAADPGLFICTCQHVGADGRPQDPFGSFPSLRSEALTATGAADWPIIGWLIAHRRRRVTMAADRAQAEHPLVVEVDWVSGACMMLRRGFAESVGGLDERFFFYSEDTDLCLTAWQSGGKVGFLPQLSITHLRGRSGGGDYLRVLRNWMTTRVQFFQKHHGPFQTAALRIIQTTVGAASFAKWCLLYLVSPSRRNVARQWVGFWLGWLTGAGSGTNA